MYTRKIAFVFVISQLATTGVILLFTELYLAVQIFRPIIICLIGLLVFKRDFTRRIAGVASLVSMHISTISIGGLSLDTIKDYETMMMLFIYIAASTNIFNITRGIMVLMFDWGERNKQSGYSDYSISKEVANKLEKINTVYLIKILAALPVSWIIVLLIPETWVSRDEGMFIIPTLICLIGLLIFGKDFTRMGTNAVLFVNLLVCMTIIGDSGLVLFLLYSNFLLFIRFIIVAVLSITIGRTSRKEEKHRLAEREKRT